MEVTKVFLGVSMQEVGCLECFLTMFYGTKDRIILFNDMAKVWKTRVISGNKDRSVGISCF